MGRERKSVCGDSAILANNPPPSPKLVLPRGTCLRVTTSVCISSLRKTSQNIPTPNIGTVFLTQKRKVKDRDFEENCSALETD